jgi:hypothetical protein
MSATWSWLGGSSGNAADIPSNWQLINYTGIPSTLPTLQDFVTVDDGTVVVNGDTLSAAI